MADMVVYDPHCMNMSVEELGKAFAPLDYPQKDFDFQLMIAIGEYANSRGVAFPGMGTLAARRHCFKMDVKRGVDRLVELRFLAVEKVKKKGAKWEHNVYTLAKRFLRKTVDRLAQHFDAEKWKHWVEEKCSARQRRKLVDRLYEQIDQDLEDAGLNTGWWMAMRYMKKHVRETPGEYDAILAEAVQKYLDYEGPNYREIADRPVKPVAQPVSTPVEDVSEEDMAKMFRVFDEHPELVDDPEKAAEMAGVSFPDMKQPVQKPVSAAKPLYPEPVDPEPWLEDYDKPIEWEDGSQWPIAQETVKQETSLETLPTNTASVSAYPTQPTMPAIVQTNIPANTQVSMENAPKFINGEVDARWRSQMMLHQVNPSMYPAW